MKTTMIAGCLAFGFLVSAVPGEAQLAPIQLKVQEIKKRDTATTGRHNDPWGYYSYRSSRSTGLTLFEIELFNSSGKAAKDVKVKWAIMVQPSGASAKPRLIEGEQTVNLSFGQRYKLETDAIVTDISTKSTYSGYYSGSGTRSRSDQAEILGYHVEVIMDGKVISSDSQPMDMRDQIARLKGEDRPARDDRPAQKDGGGQKIHRF
jgi:hypothetical protein